MLGFHDGQLTENSSMGFLRGLESLKGLIEARTLRQKSRSRILERHLILDYARTKTAKSQSTRDAHQHGNAACPTSHPSITSTQQTLLDNASALLSMQCDPSNLLARPMLHHSIFANLRELVSSGTRYAVRFACLLAENSSNVLDRR